MAEIDIGKIPPGALEIIRTLETAGHEAWLVGGCVRDLLLDRTPEDWDITTLALPEAVMDCFPHTIPTGIAHGTVTVIWEGKSYEITTYRSESDYSDFRRPDSVSFVVDICEDLTRRDFTINALAWHPDRGLADCAFGAEDLAEGIIRAVGDPEIRFGEDALRMLRAVRFAAQLDFDVDPETVAAIARLAPKISYVSGERIRVELDKWLLSAASHRWALLRETGLMRCVLPELDRCFDIAQNTPWHFTDVGTHSLLAAAAAPMNRVVRWTLLLHDLGKVDTLTVDAEGVDHFYGHEAHSERLADAVLSRLRWDNALRRRVLSLIRHHDRDILPTEKAVRRAIMAIGDEVFPDWLAVRRSDLLAQNPSMAAPALEALNAVEGLYNRILEQEHCLSIRQLAVSGSDLLALGIPEGRLVGRILKELLEWVVEEPERNAKNMLLQRAEALWQTDIAVRQ